MVIVNKASNGREIMVATGDTVRVELEQAGAAGYTWEIQDLDTEYFEVLKTETIGRPEPEDFVGAPVIRRWLLLAKKEGRVKLRFLHYRPWEGKENAVETFVLKVQIF
jgi:predicted secreted protein